MRYLFLLFVLAFGINAYASPLNKLFIESDNGAILTFENQKISFSNGGAVFFKDANKNTINLLNVAGASLNTDLEFENGKPLYFEKDGKKIKKALAYSILYKNIYENIDLRFRQFDNGLKYDFLVHPGGKISDISIEVNPDYKSIFGLQDPDIRSFAVDNNHKTYVKSEMTFDDNKIAFEVGDYDKNKTLLIDPEINLGMLFGSVAMDYAGQIEKDSFGNMYFCLHLAADVLDDNIMIGDSYNNLDVCLIKFDHDLNILWAKYFGGSKYDAPMDLAVDHNDDVWISGETESFDFPITPAAVKPYSGYRDIFLTKISKHGDILYSTLNGSTYYDAGQEIAIDSKNRVWVYGRVLGDVLIKGKNTQYYNYGYDAYLWCADESGLQYATCIGTVNADFGEGIVIDEQDNIYLTGNTYSKDFPTKNAIDDKLNGENDAYLMKLDSNANVIWSTYVGGGGIEWGQNVVIDNNGDIVLVGYSSSNGIEPGASNPLIKDIDCFVNKYDSDGNLIWSNMIGGSDDEGWNKNWDLYGGLRIANNNNIILGGRTFSSDFPIINSTAKYGGKEDGFVCSLNQDGMLLWSTLIGGSEDDLNMGIEIDNLNRVVAVGCTGSGDFPISSSSAPYSGKYDAYLVRFDAVCHETGFSIKDKTISDFFLNGEANLVEDTLKMHTKVSNTVGSAWYNQDVPIVQGFSSEFKFRINSYNQPTLSDNAELPKGGLAFVLQNCYTNAIGLSGAGLGYENIPNAIAIEFDTYKNDKNAATNKKDPTDSHISIMGMDQSLLSAHHDVQKTYQDVEIEDDGTVYHCKMVYNGIDKLLTVYFGEAGQYLENIINLNIDLGLALNLKDDIYATLGFTAANDLAIQEHDIFDWVLCPTYNEMSSVNETISEESLGISLYPNPATDAINIVYKPKKISYVSINMYDLEGKKIAVLYSGMDYPGEQLISMPLPHKIAKGLYVIEVDYGYSKKTAKLLIN